MATNKVYELGIDLQFNVGTGVHSGDPVLIGQIPGVATVDADANGLAPVDMMGVYSLSVKGVNDGGNVAVNCGDALYFVSGDTPHVSKKSTAGTLFGYAYSTTVAGGAQLIASGATATISVLIART